MAVTDISHSGYSSYSAIKLNSEEYKKTEFINRIKKENDTVHRYTFYFKDGAGNL